MLANYFQVWIYMLMYCMCICLIHTVANASINTYSAWDTLLNIQCNINNNNYLDTKYILCTPLQRLGYIVIINILFPERLTVTPDHKVVCAAYFGSLSKSGSQQQAK